MSGKLSLVSPTTDNVHFEIYGPDDGTTTIHVLDSFTNFNITGSMEFRNIIFRGDSALARSIVATSTSPVEISHPILSTIPLTKCLYSGTVSG